MNCDVQIILVSAQTVDWFVEQHDMEDKKHKQEPQLGHWQKDLDEKHEREYGHDGTGEPGEDQTYQKLFKKKEKKKKLGHVTCRCCQVRSLVGLGLYIHDLFVVPHMDHSRKGVLQ